MKAENLIREMLEEAADKRPGLREKIDSLAMLQDQQGREETQRMEQWRIVERLERVSADVEGQLAELREIDEEANKHNEDAERRHEEMKAMNEGLLHNVPSSERSRRIAG